MAQPAIIAASVAALALLRDLDIEAETAVGHSLGELTALHWAGAFDVETLLRIAEARGKAMAELAERCRRDGQPVGKPDRGGGPAQWRTGGDCRPERPSPDRDLRTGGGG